MSAPLIILADDLTGAADSAGRCWAAGLVAAVLLRPGPLPAVGAVALTSDSRHLPPAEAAAQVRATATSIRAPADAVWLKKIDSTLRGNIAAEVGALLAALGREVAVVCPAFPAQGRALVGGRLVAPGLAGPGPSLPEILAAADRPVASIGAAEVRGGRLAVCLADLVRQGSRILICDAETDDDLDRIEAATASAIPEALRVGSAGLAGAVARSLIADSRYLISDKAGDTAVDRPVALVVVGSGSRQARRQVEHMRHAGAICVEVAPDAEGVGSIGYRLSATGHGRPVVLHLPPPPGAQLDGPGAREVAARLADTADAAVRALDPGLVVLVGGDTAGAVLARRGVARLDVLRELLPGAPLCRGAEAGGRERLFALKAGSFGGDDALELVTRALR